MRNHTTESSHTARLVRVALLTLSLIVVLLMAAQALGLFRLVPVLSGSMSGFVEAGDVAVLRPLPADDVSVGDVVAFQPPVNGAPMTLHRVIEVRAMPAGTAIRTMGDANPVADPWETVLSGTAWRGTGTTFAGLGRIALWFQSLTVRIALLVATLLALLIGLLRPRRGVSDDEVRALAADRTGVPIDEIVVRDGPKPRATVLVATVVVLLPALFAGGVVAALVARAGASQLVSTSTVAQPTGLTIEDVCGKAGAGSTVIRWSAPAGDIDRYEVLRGSAADGPFTLIATVEAETLEHTDADAPAKEGFYTVRARVGTWTSAIADSGGSTGGCTPGPQVANAGGELRQEL